MPSSDRFDCLGVLHFAIFDMLCLVQHDEVKLPLPIPVGVSPNQRIARHDHIVELSFGKALSPPRSVKRQHAQSRRKLLCLVYPMWTPDSSDKSPRIRNGDFPQFGRSPHRLQQSQNLQSLSQAHFVRQNAAESRMPQKIKPSHTSFLIETQNRI